MQQYTSGFDYQGPEIVRSELPKLPGQTGLPLFSSFGFVECVLAVAHLCVVLLNLVPKV